QCGPRECLPPTVFAWTHGYAGFVNAVSGPRDVQAAESVYGDIDGDGDTDLLVPATAGGQPVWHLRRLTAAIPTGFGAAVSTGIPYGGRGVLLDIDGDGRLDLLATEPTLPAKNWLLHRSRGDGSFDPPVDIGLSSV